MKLPEHNKVFTERVGHRVYTESQVQALVDRINELEANLAKAADAALAEWKAKHPSVEAAA